MGTILLLDGGMGRELHRRGAPFRQPEWSALALTEAPDIVRETHLDYIRAGADVITANSYALVPFHIGSRFESEAETLAATAGRLAREAADQGGRKVEVAASLPPLFGSYRPDLFDAAAAPVLAEPLLNGLAQYADIWLSETQSSTAEALFWKSVLPQDGKPWWVSFTLEDTREHDKPLLRSGEQVGDAVKAVCKAGAAAVLFNCSRPEVMSAAVAEARAVLDTLDSPARLGVYANAFEPVVEEMNAANEGLDEIRKDTTPPNYLDWAKEWLAAGADTVGGCCGIGPEHIAALAALK
ncbi:homocysteine S-methyltransferase family protein [Neisseria animalis]|uniref:Homocysteine S-methyltransferase family protein n=1 Tax=Neisseria animalis TaxID=492 RepID=A0A5P3MR23_NEIAN|nr:homocysteine S-methyltransferase family protein [Neisseria animalis]QEY24043.1 homocysteine S-methyltransferase family protein [Neisseria animalis]ROW32611.1 homocysteine S-methyltransferase family protein [Neisseria animalis]VEE06151.1 Homocysteine S-methyltransferase [Neisseria animalis]